MKISKSCSQGLLGALEFVLSLSTMEKYWELLIQEATELQIYVQGIQRTYKIKKEKKSKTQNGLRVSWGTSPCCGIHSQGPAVALPSLGELRVPHPALPSPWNSSVGSAHSSCPAPAKPSSCAKKTTTPIFSLPQPQPGPGSVPFDTSCRVGVSSVW